MRKFSSFGKLIVLLSTIATFGCNSGVQDPPMLAAIRSRQMFALQSVDGIPLPAPYAPNPAVASRIVADTLVFFGDGRGEERRVTEYVYDDNDLPIDGVATPGIRRSLTPFTYESTDDGVAVAYECPGMASCVAPPHHRGTLNEGLLVITFSVTTRAPLVFKEINMAGQVRLGDH